MNPWTYDISPDRRQAWIIAQPADSPIKWVIRARAAIAKATYTMEHKQ